MSIAKARTESARAYWAKSLRSTFSPDHNSHFDPPQPLILFHTGRSLVLHCRSARRAQSGYPEVQSTHQISILDFTHDCDKIHIAVQRHCRVIPPNTVAHKLAQKHFPSTSQLLEDSVLTSKNLWLSWAYNSKSLISTARASDWAPVLRHQCDGRNDASPYSSSDGVDIHGCLRACRKRVLSSSSTFTAYLGVFHRPKSLPKLLHAGGTHQASPSIESSAERKILRYKGFFFSVRGAGEKSLHPPPGLAR